MNTLGPFAMYAAFPRSDYYEPSAPPHGHRPTTRLPAGHRLDGVTNGEPCGGSHVHRSPINGRGARLCPCDIAVTTPQAFTTASLPSTSKPPGSSRHPKAPVRIAHQPTSIGFELAYLLRSFTTPVPCVHRPISLTRPGPSDSPGPSRLCQGRLPPARVVSRRPAALSFTRPLRRPGGEVLPPPLGNTAPRGARSPRSRPWTGPNRYCR